MKPTSRRTEPGRDEQRPERNPHDPEGFARAGMAAGERAADDAETMASTGNADSSFRDVAAGTATGRGLDRGDSIGTDGLDAREDLDGLFLGEPDADAVDSYEDGVAFLRGPADEGDEED